MGSKTVGIGFVLSANAKQATSEVQTFGKTVSSAISSITSGVSGGFAFMDHAIRVGEKAWRLLNDTIGDALRQALAFQTDGSFAKHFADLARSSDLVKARLGDALLPVLDSFAVKLKPLLDSLQKWIVANGQIISNGFREFVIGATNDLIDGLFPALKAVAFAVSGWQELFGFVENAWIELVGTFKSGMLMWDEFWASYQNAMGRDDEAVKFTQAALKLREWGATANETIETNREKMKQSAATYDEWSKRLDIAHESLGHVVQSIDELAKREGVTVGGVLNADDLKKSADEAEKAAKAFEHLAHAMAGGLNVGITAAVKAHTDELATQAAAVERLRTLYNSLGETIGTALGKAASGEMTLAGAAKSAGQAILQSMRAAAIHEIEMGAARAAVETFAANVGIAPIIGVPIAAGMAAAAFALAEGYLSHFNSGGFVGGFGNRDSVPAVLTPGEYVMSQREVGNGRADWQPSRGGDVNVTLTMPMLAPPSEAEAQRKLGHTIITVVRNAINTGELQIA